MYFNNYAGFILENEAGDTIATETVATASNTFGFGALYSDRRSLIAREEEVSTPFTGTLRLVDGWFAGVAVSLCTFPYEVPAVTLSVNTIVNADRELIRITDLNGVVVSKETNIVLIYHYDDGSVERVFLAE